MINCVVNDDHYVSHNDDLCIRTKVSRRLSLKSSNQLILNSDLILYSFVLLVFFLLINLNGVAAMLTVHTNNDNDSPVFYDIINDDKNTVKKHHHKPKFNQKEAVTERCHLIPTKEQLVFTNYDASSLYIEEKRLLFNRSTNELKRKSRHLPVYNK